MNLTDPQARLAAGTHGAGQGGEAKQYPTVTKLEEGMGCHPVSRNPGRAGLCQGRVTQAAVGSPVEGHSG